jgi:predicted XRE-type DNA-binding protein
MSQTPKFQESSGNVFADLGLPNAPELQAKADLAWEISRTIDERELTQTQAAELLGIDQPKVSALVRGRLSGFSMERLYRFLNALGKDVEIVVRSPASRKVEPGVHVATPDRRAAKRSATDRKSKRRLARG